MGKNRKSRSTTQSSFVVWPWYSANSAKTVGLSPSPIQQITVLIKHRAVLVCGPRNAFFAVMKNIDVDRVARRVSIEWSAASNIALWIAVRSKQLKNVYLNLRDRHDKHPQSVQLDDGPANYLPRVSSA